MRHRAHAPGGFGDDAVTMRDDTTPIKQAARALARAAHGGGIPGHRRAISPVPLLHAQCAAVPAIFHDHATPAAPGDKLRQLALGPTGLAIQSTPR